MSHATDPTPFLHRAYAVDADGRETPIEAHSIVIRLAGGESVELPLDGFDADDLLVYGGRMPADTASEDEAVTLARRLLVAPGATNLIALSVLPDPDDIL
jgi:hypothetical protein